MASADKWYPPTSKQVSGTTDHLRIALIGKTATGKSATGNTLIGERVFESKENAKFVTTECKVAQKERFDVTLEVVDTPGVLDPSLPKEALVKQLVSCSCLASPGVHALLLVLKIGHRYIDGDEKTIKLVKKTFGKDFVSRTIVVFTGKDSLDDDKKKFENYKAELPTTIKDLVRSCKGGGIAISNKGSPAERNQAAKQIIAIIKEVVGENGGKDCYYRPVMFNRILEVIEEKSNRIMEGNAEIEKKIRLLQIEKEQLTRDDKTEQLQTLKTKIRDLEKQLINKETARLAAIRETESSRGEAIILGLCSIVGFVGFGVLALMKILK